MLIQQTSPFKNIKGKGKFYDNLSLFMWYRVGLVLA